MGVELPAEGEVIAGRYRVDELLGQGGMGAVFRATQLGLMRGVALKVLLPERSGPRVRERFEREARVAAAMHHDGVVDVYDFGVDDQDRLYLVMELLIGEPLSQRVSDGNRDEGEACAVVGQVAAALDAAHSVGLVHRDIKPDNIFCLDVPDGEPTRVKVVDFGLAFIRDGGELGRLTADTIVSGTPDYMAPEQCRGNQDLGPAVDVYALGCVLMELLTGEPPFQGQQGDLIAQHLHVPAPRLLARRPDVSADVADILERMLDKKPERRPTSADVAVAFLGHGAAKEAQEKKGAGRLDRALAPQVGHHSTAVDTQRDDVTTDVVVERPVVVVRGEGQAGLSIALGVNGFVVLEQPTIDTDEDGTGSVEILIKGTPAQVRRRRAAKATVIAGADPEDLEALTSLVTAGAAEVISLPVNLEELAHKVIRAQRRASREAKR